MSNICCKLLFQICIQIIILYGKFQQSHYMSNKPFMFGNFTIVLCKAYMVPCTYSLFFQPGSLTNSGSCLEL